MIIEAICRNCGEVTACVDTELPKNNYNKTGWDFTLQTCCHEHLANPCIDIVIKEGSE